MSLAVGTELEHYQLIERVGQGGMSVVYKGYDNKLQRHVAIKVLHRHLASHKEANARFKREAYAVAKLKHENILDIYDYSNDDNEESFIVTEFIDGPTLKVFMDDHVGMLPEIGAMIGSQICTALVHAHDAGIIHRDIKPENVMVRSDGVLKLMDFGIAQMLDVTRMTATGQLLGSPAYMSPEHVKGKRLDHRTDIFAVGIVLYQLVTGALPFQGNNTHEVLKKIADCEFIEPCRLNPKVPKELSRIIQKALAEEPDDRHQSVQALNKALMTFLHKSGIEHPRPLSKTYFTKPNDTELTIKNNLVPFLVAKGKKERSEAPTQAIETFNRVLALEPNHPEIKHELAMLAKASTRTQRIKTTIAVALSGIALLGIAYGVKSMANKKSQVRTLQAPKTSDNLENISPKPINQSPQKSNNVSSNASVVDSAETPSKVLTSKPSAPPPPVKQTTTVKRPPNKPAKKSRTQKNIAANSATTKLVVIPHRGSEYRIGDAEWNSLNSSSLILKTKIGDVISARNTTCCQEKQVVVSERNANSARLKLGFLPGSMTPMCDAPDTKVSINGKSSRLNKAATIIIKRATGTESVNVVFVHGGSIDKKRVSIKAKENKEVTCNF